MSSPKLELSDNVKISVGKRIRQARKKLGLTQAEVAQRIGLKGPAAVNKYELGRALPPGEDLARLAAALGVTVGWLFEESDKRLPLVADPVELYGKGLSGEDKEILGAVREALKTLSPKQKDHFFNQVFWLAGNVGDPPKRRRK